MSGTLSVVATPIGNLEDITLRALRVLREAQVIAAEDTRRTAKLLSHYGIQTPMLSFHSHNARARTPQLLSRLAAGAHVALVTDAGTPGISDPGVELVEACRHHGISVDPLPGASASLTAAVGSGFPLNPLTFCGFPPLKGRARHAWLSSLAASTGTTVFFEAPHRIEATLRDLALFLGNRTICVARELTKTHQEFKVGAANDPSILSITRKGEFSIVVAPPEPADTSLVDRPDAEIVSVFLSFDQPLASGGRRGVAALVAKQLGLSVNRVYQAIERTKI